MILDLKVETLGVNYDISISVKTSIHSNDKSCPRKYMFYLHGYG